MSTTTPRLELYKPEDDGSEIVNVATDLNDNLDKLDSAVGFVPTTESTEATVLFDGAAKHETDTGRAFFRKLGSWTQLLSQGATFLSDIILGTGKKIGIGTTVAPTAVFDIFGTPGEAFMKFRMSGDTIPRVQIDDAGIKFSNGSSGLDARVYRTGANQLNLDGNVTVEDNLNVQGTTSMTGVSITGDVDIDGAILDLTVDGDLDVTGVGQFMVARKLVDTDRTNTTTQIDDTELTFTVEANCIYIVDAYLYITGATAGDMSFAWGGPAGATFLRHCVGPSAGTTDLTASTARMSAHQIGTQVSYGTASTSTFAPVRETGLLIVGSTGGTFNLKLNQTTANATASTLRANSFVTLRKIVA